MSAPPRDLIGTVSWSLLLSNGQYVYNPHCPQHGCPGCKGYDIRSAHVWIGVDGSRALEHAARTPWIGTSATAVRSRP